MFSHWTRFCRSHWRAWVKIRCINARRICRWCTNLKTLASVNSVRSILSPAVLCFACILERQSQCCQSNQSKSKSGKLPFKTLNHIFQITHLLFLLLFLTSYSSMDDHDQKIPHLPLPINVHAFTYITRIHSQVHQQHVEICLLKIF